jgi:hypothetical protein
MPQKMTRVKRVGILGFDFVYIFYYIEIVRIQDVIVVRENIMRGERLFCLLIRKVWRRSALSVKPSWKPL